MSLKNSVMVVTLNISQWTARKKDAAVNREVEENHGATDAGNYSKHLISKDVVVNTSAQANAEKVFMNPLKAIQKLAGSARTYHYFNTLPWSDTGDRILPSRNYFNYITEMNRFRTEFDSLVDEFMNQYPALVKDAEKRLNTLFNPADYPSEKDLRRKFNLSFSFMPVADANDIRVSLSEEEVGKIKAQVSGEVNSRVKCAIDEMIRRIREAVQHLGDTLRGYDLLNEKGERNVKKFNDSLTGNICALIETIPLLNFSDDPHINEVVQMIEPLCVSADILRTDPEIRKEIVERVAQVMPMI